MMCRQEDGKIYRVAPSQGNGSVFIQSIKFVDNKGIENKFTIRVRKQKAENMVNYFLNNEFYKEIEFLYNRYWDEELSENDQYNFEDYAEKITKKYGWVKVYDAACNYLYTNCTNPESVINFAHLYWIYGWHEYPISKPYEFLGYFYFRIDMDTEKYDEINILDSLATSILPKSGYAKADLYNNPNYLPETDSMLLDTVEAYKTRQ